MALRRRTQQELAEKYSELSNRTQKNRESIIESELSVIEVFCDRTETELRIGNRNRANEALKEAKKAVAETQKRLSELPRENQFRSEIKQQLEELLTRVHALENAE